MTDRRPTWCVRLDAEYKSIFTALARDTRRSPTQELRLLVDRAVAAQFQAPPRPDRREPAP